ncbi:phage tail tape measure protein [Rapidithrix thailandica]|uniref:Phage tail tape measure protein n=1 Tax=Rapidithrix thailandica TaxID=413964 RepID=A0AAW9SF26_9BACT
MPAQGLINMSVLLGMDITQFEKNISKAQRQLSQFGSNMQKIGQGLTLGVTAPLAAFAASTLKAAGDFEAGMNRVAAISQATGEDLQRLRDEAKLLGSTTQFSASEASAAFETLARNGKNAGDILEGGLGQATLNLAAAVGGELAPAADLLTDVLKQFEDESLSASDAVNLVAGATNKSKFGFQDYSEAIAQVGGVAGGVGVEFLDLNAALAATSVAFKSGSDAGTSLKTFLQRIGAPTKQAKNLMKELGLEFFDTATGKMKPMGEIAGQLEKAFSGLTEEQRLNNASILFGADAMRTGIQLARTGKDAFNDLASEIEKVSAQELAETRMKGFAGAVKEFQSAWEGLQIAIADSGLLDFATKVVKKFAEVVRQLSQANPSILKLGTILGGVAAAIGPIVLAIGAFASSLSSVIGLASGIGGLGAAFAALTGPVGIAVAAVAGAVALIIANWDKIKAYFTTGSGSKTFEALKERIKTAFENIKTIISFFSKVWDKFGNDIVDIFVQKFARLGEIAGIVFGRLLDVFNIFSNLFTGNWKGMWISIKSFFLSTFKIIPITLAGIVKDVVMMAESLVNNLSGKIPGLKSIFGEGFSFEGIIETIDSVKDKSIQFIDDLIGKGEKGKQSNEELAKSFEDVAKAIDKVDEKVKDEDKKEDDKTKDDNKTIPLAPKYKSYNTDRVKRNSLQTLQTNVPQLPGLNLGKQETDGGLGQELGALAGQFDLINTKAQLLGESYNATAEKQSLMQQGIRNLIDNGLIQTQEQFAAVTEQIGEMAGKMEEVNPVWQKFGESMAASVGNAVQAVASGAQSIKESIRGIIKAFIAEGVAAVISNTFKSLGIAGPFAIPIAAAAGAAATALFEKAIPAFAGGGDHLGGLRLVGENGPELEVTGPSRIYNARKTQDILSNMGGSQDVKVSGEFRIQGQDLVVTLDKANRFNDFTS